MDDFIQSILGFKGEKEKVFNKFVNRVRRFNNYEDFFNFEEKNFKFVANKMLRKIAKLYAIIEKSDNISKKIN
jgi:hypothetical protein